MDHHHIHDAINNCVTCNHNHHPPVTMNLATEICNTAAPLHSFDVIHIRQEAVHHLGPLAGKQGQTLALNAARDRDQHQKTLVGDI